MSEESRKPESPESSPDASPPKPKSKLNPTILLVSFALFCAAFTLMVTAARDRKSAQDFWQRANETMVAAEKAQLAAENLQAKDHLIDYLANLRLDVIRWVRPDGSKQLFNCYRIDVNGPYRVDQPVTWRTCRVDRYEDYAVGSYDKIGDRVLYNYHHDTVFYNYRLFTCQLINIDGVVYSVEADYWPLDEDRDDKWKATYGKYEIWLDGVLQGKTDFNSEITIRYDDPGNINPVEFERAYNCECGEDCCTGVCHCIEK